MFLIFFFVSGLTQDSLDRSPWFEYNIFTPICSAHICGMLVLCYRDNRGCVRTAHFASGCVRFTILSYNAHAHNVLPW